MEPHRRIALISLFLLPFILFGQNKQTDIKKYRISITQMTLPGPNPEYRYNITKHRINIYKRVRIPFTYKYLGYEIFSKRIKKHQTDSLALLIAKANVFSIEEDYIGGGIDGISWNFKFKINKTQKEVCLDNYYMKSFGDILDYINIQLPKNKVCISFDYFGTRDDFINNNNKNRQRKNKPLFG